MKKTIFLGMGVILLALLAGFAPQAGAQTIYVATNGGHNVVNNFDTWEGACTNVNEAVALATQLVRNVVISNGTYWLTNGMTLNVGISVQGFSGNPRDVVLGKKSPWDWPPFNHFRLNHANAWLSGVTMSNRYSDGGSIFLQNGTVSNCVITKNEAAYSSSWGGGATVSGGLLTDTLVDQCSASDGGGIYQAGGTVERCVIQKCSGTGNGAVRISGAAAVMRQCRLVSNTVANAGGFYLTAGRIENCVVYGNSSAVGGGTVAGGTLLHTTVAGNSCGSAQTVGGVQQTGGAVTNCVMWGNLRGIGVSDYSGSGGTIIYSCASGLTVTNGNITDDPLFSGASTGNYQLAVGSPCRDSGTNAGVTVDYAGGTRPVDGNGDSVVAPDMGAYEAAAMAAGELAVAISSTNARSGLEPLAVTLQAVPSGDNTNLTWYGWDLNSDGTWDAAGAGLGTLATNLPAGRYTVTLRVTNTAPVGAQIVVSNLFTAVGTNIYVSPTGGHVSPYATWGTAATNLEVGFGTAVAGCTVNVNTGNYKIATTISLSFPVTLRGASGNPRDVVVDKTVDWPPFSHFSVSHSSALLSSVTVTNRYGGGSVSISSGTVSNCVVTKAEGPYSGSVGGGVVMTGGLLTDSLIERCLAGGGGSGLYLQSGGTVERCVIRNCGSKSAVRMDAGVMRQSTICSNVCSENVVLLNGGRIENCLVITNSAPIGGGKVAGGALVHVTVAGNTCGSAETVGGISQTSGGITNCIMWGNLKGAAASDYTGSGGTIVNSCASGLAISNGNIADDPKFQGAATNNYRLTSGTSPCIDKGVTLASVTNDFEGTVRPLDGDGDETLVSDMGAYEAPTAVGQPFNATISALSAVSGLNPLSVTLKAVVSGSNTNLAWCGWDFNDDGTLDVTGADKQVVTNTYGPGRFTVRLWVTNTTPAGAVAVSSNLVSVVDTNLYVSLGGSHTYPYAAWGAAATNLEVGFGAAVSGCTVNVDTGKYQIASTLAMSFAVTVKGRSGNPRDVVVWKTDSPYFSHFSVSHSNALLSSLLVSNRYADGAISISGGTVSNCVVTKAEGAYSTSVGGGVVMTGGLLTDSVIEQSRTGTGGGGALYQNGGTAQRCVFRDNGAPYPVRIDTGLIRQCQILGNAGSTIGGFLLNGGRIENCLVAGNTASSSGASGGGVVAGGALVNCTVASNSATTAGIGGISRTGGAITNCIVYFNSGSSVANYSGSVGTVWYSCAPELTHGSQGNTTNDPQFVSVANGNWRLVETSRCINAGTNFTGVASLADLDGMRRVLGGRVDMGCYETAFPGSVYNFR